MSEVFATEIVLVEGEYFKVERSYDHDQGRPWENSDGHGEIRPGARHRNEGGSKKPGEIPLNDPNRGECQYYYDWQAAVATARKEWGLGEEKLAELTTKLGRDPTQGGNRCRRSQGRHQVPAWLDQRRRVLHRCGRDPHLIRKEMDDDVFDEDDVDCFDEGEEDALWGIESEGDYWKEVQKDCIGNLLHDILKEKVEALAEAAEVQYWEERDVVTT